MPCGTGGINCASGAIAEPAPGEFSKLATLRMIVSANLRNDRSDALFAAGKRHGMPATVAGTPDSDTGCIDAILAEQEREGIANVEQLIDRVDNLAHDADFQGLRSRLRQHRPIC